MKRVKAIFPIFFIFIILSLIILFFFQNPLSGALQTLMLPVQRWTFSSATPHVSKEQTSQEKLQQENSDLRTQLAQMHEIQEDNKALHDQFEIASPAPKTLLPARIVGMHDDALLIDKGADEGLHVGDIVVVKDNLIGKVTKITPHISQVTLITNPTTSFTAKTSKTGAVGVIKAQGGDSIILDNVVLSDKLEQNDTIVTKGDLDAQGNGYPPDLIVGKIVSVNKKASSLFQSAKVESLVDFSSLQMVFVITK